MTSRPLSAAPVPSSRLSGGLLTLDRVYLFGAVGVAFAAALATSVRPNDVWWHLAEARTMVQTGAMPAVDTFTYSRAGEPFFNQMWLAQLLMYGLYRAARLPGLVTGHALAIGTAIALTARLCMLLTDRARLTAVVILGGVLPLSMTQWAVRPQPYAFALFVIVFGCLLAVREPAVRRWPFATPWLIPPAIALWANLHGSFGLGLALTTLAFTVEAFVALKERGRASERGVARLAAVTAAAWVAAMVNPHGVGIFRYVAELMTSASVARATEWAPISVTTVTGVWYFAVAIAVLLLLIHGRRRPSMTESALVVAVVFFAGMASRNTVWLGMAAAPVLSVQLASLLREPDRDDGSAAANAVILVLIILGAVVMSPWVRPAVLPGAQGSLTTDTPIAAVRHLRQLDQRPARLFSDIGYSSYLEWAAPEQKTFMDTRLELFPVEQILDYEDLSRGRHTESIVSKYGFDGMLVSRQYQRGLLEQLRTSPEWDLEYEDSEAALLLPAE